MSLKWRRSKSITTYFHTMSYKLRSTTQENSVHLVSTSDLDKVLLNGVLQLGKSRQASRELGGRISVSCNPVRKSLQKSFERWRWRGDLKTKQSPRESQPTFFDLAVQQLPSTRFTSKANTRSGTTPRRTWPSSVTFQRKAGRGWPGMGKSSSMRNRTRPDLRQASSNAISTSDTKSTCSKNTRPTTRFFSPHDRRRGGNRSSCFKSFPPLVPRPYTIGREPP